MIESLGLKINSLGPSKFALNRAAANNHIKVVKLAAERKMLPDAYAYAYRMAMRNENREVTKWIFETFGGDSNMLYKQTEKEMVEYQQKAEELIKSLPYKWSKMKSSGRLSVF